MGNEARSKFEEQKREIEKANEAAKESGEKSEPAAAEPATDVKPPRRARKS